MQFNQENLDRFRQRKQDNTLTYEETEKREVVCPAALATNVDAIHRAVKCRVDDSIITNNGDPTTFRRCTSEKYLECPAWILHKQEMEKK